MISTLIKIFVMISFFPHYRAALAQICSKLKYMGIMSRYVHVSYVHTCRKHISVSLRANRTCTACV